MTDSIISFYDWLNESEHEELGNDARGKLHELLVAAHLNHLIHGSFHHAHHFRDKNGNTPEEAHNKLAKPLNPEVYQKLSANARSAAEEIHKHIKENHPELLNKSHHTRVSWTSLKSDHEKLTGVKDAAHSGGADIMVSSHDKKSGELHHAVGYSLKIAKNKITTGQLGSANVERIIGSLPGELSKHDENKKNDINKVFDNHGHKSSSLSETDKHNLFKISRDSTKASNHKLETDIRNVSNTHSAKKAESFSKKINSMSLSEKKARLVDLVAPKHTYPTYQAATSPVTGETHIKNEHEDIKTKYNNAKELQAYQSSGIRNSVLIKDHTGRTLNRIEVRAKRPVAPSEFIIK